MTRRALQGGVLTGMVSLLSPLAAAQASACPPQPQWRGAAVDAALRYNIDPPLMLAMVTQESQWCPTARSSAGALGLGQLMPGTARDMGVTHPFDPVQNLNGSARYLRLQLNRFGRVDLALAAYNAGPERVKHAGGIPAIAETQRHVQQVLAYYAAFQRAPTPAPAAQRGPITPPAPRPIYASGMAPPPAVRPALASTPAPGLLSSGGAGQVPAPRQAKNAAPPLPHPAPIPRPVLAAAQVSPPSPVRVAARPETPTPAPAPTPSAPPTPAPAPERLVQVPAFTQPPAPEPVSAAGITVITNRDTARPPSTMTVIRVRR